MTTLARPAHLEALDFYQRALPLVDALVTLARAWRDRAPADPAAIEAHAEYVYAATRVDLRLTRHRTLTAEQAPAEPGAPHTAKE